ncbi:MAG: hypothetical protein KatS3mg032_1755 [Cyclobacteriaceae bacterium]|nr:MAG: hypothetical protein KatS3mg032_1755 [Cyclobacteriaceae bacterium]
MRWVTAKIDGKQTISLEGQHPDAWANGNCHFALQCDGGWRQSCSSGASCQNFEKEGIFSQKVRRDDVVPSRRGVLYLTSDLLIFKTLKPKAEKYNFSIAYHEIQSIRPFYGFIIPNQIRLYRKDETSLRLLSYRKKEIIKRTRQKIMETNSYPPPYQKNARQLMG